VPAFNNYDARLTATQTLFDFSSAARVRAARAQANGTSADRNVVVEAAAQAAAVAYLRTARATASAGARRADSSIAAELVRRAVATRPDLLSEAARGVAARRTGSAIAAERLPRISVEGDYGVNGLTVPGSLATRQLALQVTIPLLDGFRREGRLAEQNAAVGES